MISPGKQLSPLCAFKRNLFTLNESQLPKMRSYYFFPVLSDLLQEVSTGRDILTGLPYMQRLCTLTHNALSDKQKQDLLSLSSRGILVVTVKFALKAGAKLNELFSQNINTALVLCIFTWIFLYIYYLNEIKLCN